MRGNALCCLLREWLTIELPSVRPEGTHTHTGYRRSEVDTGWAQSAQCTESDHIFMHCEFMNCSQKTSLSVLYWNTLSMRVHEIQLTLHFHTLTLKGIFSFRLIEWVQWYFRLIYGYGFIRQFIAVISVAFWKHNGQCVCHMCCNFTRACGLVTQVLSRTNTEPFTITLHPDTAPTQIHVLID